MDENLTCSNPDCQVEKTRSCLQGHDPVQACPNFGKPQVEEPTGVTDDATLKDAVEDRASVSELKLAPGQQLTQDGVDAFQLRRAGRLVAIVGDTSSGKSTLLCSIYNKFQRGHFAERSFVASTTLGAFERLAHLSRASSGARIPDTKRTYLSEGLHYYHLALAPLSEPGERFDLLMSDRPGETYRSGVHRPEEFAAMPELTFARIVVVLIDGTRLSQAEERHEILDLARRTVRAMIDGGALNRTQHLQLVLTKRDEVEHSGMASDLIAKLKTVTERLKTNFGPQFASITFFETAARDPKGRFTLAHGCDALLTSWVSVADPGTYAVMQSEPRITQFDRLAANQIYGTPS